jgi:TPR repeat protein
MAETWLRKAADLEHPPAQFEVGRRLLAQQAEGEAAEEAMRWIVRAAKQGHPRACYTLAGCYGQGLAVQRDPVTAWAWCSIAAERGEPKAELLLPQYLELLDDGQRAAGSATLKVLRDKLPPVRI